MRNLIERLSPPMEVSPNSLNATPAPPEDRRLPTRPSIKKAPYKQGWTKEEHRRFLDGLQKFGKGSWKEIAGIVRTRTPTQIQSHAQKVKSSKKIVLIFSIT
jgi:SHAQKYF class myb-like DNA-binding protein